MTALEKDYTQADLAEADREMLEYVTKLTRTPADVTAEDAGRLKGCGFCDAAILDICQVASYYAFVNRLAQGLGVELEAPGDLGH